MRNEKIIQTIGQCLTVHPDAYPLNDIGISKLFYTCFKNYIVYVQETKCWYIYKKFHWVKDEANLLVMEVGKEFVMAFTQYALAEDKEEIIKLATRLCSRAKRESIIKDACSIEPKSLSVFDSNPYLFNCKNGTFNLSNKLLQPHDPQDYITKVSNVLYNPACDCVRWKSFINEIMKDNTDNSKFLQKSLWVRFKWRNKLRMLLYFLWQYNTKRQVNSLRNHFIRFGRLFNPRSSEIFSEK